MNIDRVICKNQTAVRIENSSDEHFYYKVTNKTVSLHQFLDTEGYLPPSSTVLLQLVVNGENKNSKTENQEMLYVFTPEESDVEYAFREYERDIRKVVFCYSDRLLDDTDDRTLKIQDSNTNEHSKAKFEEQAESSQSYSNVVRLSRKKQSQSKTFTNSLSEAINVSLPVLPHNDALRSAVGQVELAESAEPADHGRGEKSPLGYENSGESNEKSTELEIERSVAGPARSPIQDVLATSGLRTTQQADSAPDMQERMKELDPKEALTRLNFSDSGNMFEQAYDVEPIESVVRIEAQQSDSISREASIVNQTKQEVDTASEPKSAENQEKQILQAPVEKLAPKPPKQSSPCNLVVEELREHQEKAEKCAFGELANVRPHELRDDLKSIENRVASLEKEALNIQALEKQLARASGQLDELAGSVHLNVRMVRHGRFEQLATCATVVLVVLLYKLLRL